MKKTYNQPTVEVQEMETQQPMLAGSGDKLDINSDIDDAVEEIQQLSRRHSSVWDDDEEVEY